MLVAFAIEADLICAGDSWVGSHCLRAITSGDEHVGPLESPSEWGLTGNPQERVNEFSVLIRDVLPEVTGCQTIR